MVQCFTYLVGGGSKEGSNTVNDIVGAFSSNLEVIMTALSAVLITSIIAIVLLARNRSSKPATEEILPPPTPPLNQTMGEEVEELPVPRSLSNMDLGMLRKLSEFEVMHFNNLIEHLNISRVDLARLLNELRGRGLIQLDGEYVVLTDKGRRFIELIEQRRGLRTPGTP